MLSVADGASETVVVFVQTAPALITKAAGGRNRVGPGSRDW